jgi:hypothetical protein
MIRRTMTCHLLLAAILMTICPGAPGQSLKPVPRSATRGLNQWAFGASERHTATRLVRAGESDIQLPDDSVLPAPSAADLERRREEKHRRFRQIIDRLKTLQDNLQKAKEVQATRPEEPSLMDPESPSQGSDAASNGDEPSHSAAAGTRQPEANAQQQPDSPVPSSTPESAVPPSGLDAGTDEGVVAGIDLAGDVLVDGPVDQVALADNLYRVNEYALALKIYSQVDVRQLSDDQQFWVQFQTASCHRHLGDLPAAREQFRIIAGQPESGWLGRSSTWWLNTLRDRAELEEQLSTMQEQISMKMEVSDDAE